MTDIIHRLRDGTIRARLAIVEGMTPEGISLMGEAADEIERLRAALQASKPCGRCTTPK